MQAGKWKRKLKRKRRSSGKGKKKGELRYMKDEKKEMKGEK